MQNELHNIPLLNLALGFLPAAVVLCIVIRWSLNGALAIQAIIRMLVQLLLIGYLLTYLLNTDRAPIVLCALIIMVTVSSWIALGPIPHRRIQLYSRALSSILIGGGITFILATQIVLELKPWYAPRFVIPLAGMIFANAMTSISLAAERLTAEIDRTDNYEQARNIAMNAAMIPTINALLAVGLVSLPGMMTGQILAGISPLIAARYQIMVMCMIFGSTGISVACFLMMARSAIERSPTDTSKKS